MNPILDSDSMISSQIVQAPEMKSDISDTQTLDESTFKSLYLAAHQRKIAKSQSQPDGKGNFLRPYQITTEAPESEQ